MSFPVPNDDYKQIQNALALSYPFYGDYFTSAYIRSVASKPYSKDRTIRRPLLYTIDKLLAVLKWREESKAVLMMQILEESKNCAAAIGPHQLLANTLNTGSMYVDGYTKEGLPVLWIRTKRKPWVVGGEFTNRALIHKSPETNTSLLSQMWTLR